MFCVSWAVVFGALLHRGAVSSANCFSFFFLFVFLAASYSRLLFPSCSFHFLPSSGVAVAQVIQVREDEEMCLQLGYCSVIMSMT